jgi:hypothetical protein
MRVGLIQIFLLLSTASFISAQTDSSTSFSPRRSGINKSPNDTIVAPATAIKPSGDSLNKKPTPRIHSPKKAGLYSALLPGLGQAYNRKYWKVGVLVAGAGALVYGYQFNQRNYNSFKDELIKRQQGLGNLDESLVFYTDANLLELQDFYRRNRDLTIIGMGLLYALNIIDAVVDAHLFDFNVNEDLSLHIRPECQTLALRPVPGLGLSLRF